MLGLRAVGEAALAALVYGDTDSILLPVVDALEAPSAELVWLVEIDCMIFSAGSTPAPPPPPPPPATSGHIVEESGVSIVADTGDPIIW